MIAISNSVGEIGLDLVINQNRFNKQLNGIEKVAKKAAAGIAGAFAINKAFDLGKSAVNLASDLEEVQNVVDVTFPSMTRKVDEWSQRAAASFGLSETMAKKYTGTFGAMSKAFGFAEKEAYDMSTTLTGLAGDLASFYNISQDEAYTKLKSVFTGETETLKELGVVMTQNALDQYALANGYGVTTKAMTEQEKVALRYQFVMSQLSLANNDFSRTSGNWANQMRILKLQFDSFLASMGSGLLVVLTPAIQAINAFMAKLVAAANTFKNFMATLSGKKIKKNTIASVATSADTTAASVGNIGKAATGVGKAAQKAAKDMKSMMGFDQINKISAPTSSGDSGSSGGGGGISTEGNSIPSPLAELDEEEPARLESKYLKFSKSLGVLKKEIGECSAIIKSGLKWGWKNVLVPLGEWTISKAVPKGLDLLSSGISVLNATLTAFEPIWKVIWSTFIKPIGKFTGKVFITALTGISKALGGIGSWMKNHQGIVTAMETAVVAFFGAWKVSNLVSFIQASGGVVGILSKMSVAIKAATLGKIKEKIETAQLMALYIKDTAITAKNTAVKGANALINGKLGKSAQSAAKKITVLTVAQKAASVAALGIVGAIAGLAIYMKKTGKSADELADDINKFADKFAVGVECFADAIPNMLPKVISAFEKLLNTLIKTVPKWGPPLLNAGVNLFTSLTQAIPKAIPVLVAAMPTIIKALASAILQCGAALINAFGSLFAQAGSKAWNAITSPFRAIGSFFSGIVSTVRSIFSNIGTSIGGAISGAFKGAMNSALKTVENAVNKAISLINGAIKIINKLPGVNLKKIGSVKLPRLAEGGYVKKNTPQLAMIGDNRHQGEVVAPEDKLEAMARKAASMAGGGVSPEIIELLNAILEVLKNLGLDIYLDGDKVTKKVVNKINAKTAATGVCEINL